VQARSLRPSWPSLIRSNCGRPSAAFDHDMQRDFLEPGGFGEMLGNDVSQLP
jgi:hypothetical protein